MDLDLITYANEHTNHEDDHSDGQLCRTAEYRRPGTELDIVDCARSLGHGEPTIPDGRPFEPRNHPAALRCFTGLFVPRVPCSMPSVTFGKASNGRRRRLLLEIGREAIHQIDRTGWRSRGRVCGIGDMAVNESLGVLAQIDIRGEGLLQDIQREVLGRIPGPALGYSQPACLLERRESQSGVRGSPSGLLRRPEA